MRVGGLGSELVRSDLAGWGHVIQGHFDDFDVIL